MGVYIVLNIRPDAISKKEWENIYAETLELVNAYPLASIFREDFGFNERLVFDKAREQSDEEGKFWSVTGDLESKERGETFRLYKNLEKYLGDIDTGDKDILQVQLEGGKGLSVVFDEKTQGKKYHYYMLSIAALIEDRLKGRAMVYGNITKEQAGIAIKLANDILKKPIGLPVRVNESELLTRLQELGLKSIDNFSDLYITENEDSMGDFIRENFSEDEIISYFKGRLKDYQSANQLGAVRRIIHFLNMGYSLEKLYDICCISEDGPRFGSEDFLKSLCDTWVFVEKEYREAMNVFIKQADRPQFVEYQFGTAFLDMCGLSGRYCNRYIPIEDGIRILKDMIKDNIEIESKIKSSYDETVDILKIYGEELDDIFDLDDDTEDYNIITEYEELIGWSDDIKISESLDNGLKHLTKVIRETAESSEAALALDGFSKEAFINVIIKLTDKYSLLLSRDAWNWIEGIEDLRLYKYIFLMVGLSNDKDGEEIVRSMLENRELFNRYMVEDVS